jgi:hypothetical protein
LYRYTISRCKYLQKIINTYKIKNELLKIKAGKFNGKVLKEKSYVTLTSCTGDYKDSIATSKK